MLYMSMNSEPRPAFMDSSLTSPTYIGQLMAAPLAPRPPRNRDTISAVSVLTTNRMIQLTRYGNMVRKPVVFRPKLSANMPQKNVPNMALSIPQLHAQEIELSVITWSSGVSFGSVNMGETVDDHPVYSPNENVTRFTGTIIQ